MEQLDFKLNVENNYEAHSSSIGMGILEGFLSYDVGSYSAKNWIEFLNNPKSTFELGNYSYVEKNNDKIFIGFEDRWTNAVTDSEIFETTAAELTYILDRWQEACEKKPKRIIITRDNGKVTVDFED